MSSVEGEVSDKFQQMLWWRRPPEVAHDQLSHNNVVLALHLIVVTLFPVETWIVQLF
jgi:hypothetical protein